jgi:sulfoxide reductase heme-binding subunit YedZ
MAGNAYLRSFGKHWMKPLTLLAIAAPFLYLAYLWTLMLTNINPYSMGFNFVQWTHRYLGDTAIRMLLVTLAISPIRDITGWAPITLIRRRIGLAAFFYAALHLLAYLWLDRGWSLEKLWEDVMVRTYIMFGMVAVVSMIPLAITSTNGMIRRLGRKTWDRLHWLIYPLAIFAVAHNLLMVKVIEGDPLTHAIILAILLGWRIMRWGLKLLKPAEAPAA